MSEARRPKARLDRAQTDDWQGRGKAWALGRCLLRSEAGDLRQGLIELGLIIGRVELRLVLSMQNFKVVSGLCSEDKHCRAEAHERPCRAVASRGPPMGRVDPPWRFVCYALDPS